MKIVHCFFTMDMGGAQVLAVDMLNKMCVEHETALIIVNNCHSQALLDKLDQRVALHKIDRREGSRNPWPLLKFNLLLRRLKPDIIHCHEPDIGKIIRARIGTLIYTIHTVDIPTTHYHYYAALVAISDAVQQELVGRFDRPVETVYNGLDVAHFRKRTNYSLAEKTFRLVQVSRLTHKVKGQDVLLKALHYAKTHFGFTNFTLDFVGSGSSLEYLQELTAQLGLTGEVNFLGEQNRDWLYDNIAQYHLLVQPSRYEGFGLTILEGFAAGLPVLASDIEGPAEIIGRTPRGFLFPNGDYEACGKLLYRVFQEYAQGTMEQLMRNTAPITDNEYSIETCVAGYLDQYKALL